MKTIRIISFFLSIFCAQITAGQNLEWELRFDSKFDNHEKKSLEHLGTAPSQTLFSTRLAPNIGVGWSDDKAHHRIMVGGSFTFDFGVSPSYSNQLEPIVYYNFTSPSWSAYAGKFERRHLIGGYSRVIYAAIASFYDNIVDGFAVQSHSREGKIEFVLDWDGAKSTTERESFRIMSAGELTTAQKRTFRWFETGYSFEWYHLANRAGWDDGVVDHLTADVWVGAALEQVVPWFERFALRVGVTESFDRDRAGENRWLTPSGFMLDVALQKWRIGIRNRTYTGDTQMPLWSLYGNRVYKGDPFFAGTGFYNYTQIYWSPRIGRGVDINLEVGLHADDRAVGFQQVAQIGVTLNNDFFKRK